MFLLTNYLAHRVFSQKSPTETTSIMLSGNKCRYTTTDYFESVISPMTHRSLYFTLHVQLRVVAFHSLKRPTSIGKLILLAAKVLDHSLSSAIQRNYFLKTVVRVGTILNRVSLLQNEVYQNNQSEPVYWIWFCLKKKKSQIIELIYGTWGQNNIFFKRNFTKWSIVIPH